METENLSRIYDILAQMAEDLGAAKNSPFNSEKACIDRKQFLDSILAIHAELPEEIDLARKVLEERDAILDEAHKEAELIAARADEAYQARIREAEETREAMVNETEVMQQASAEAGQILADAHRVDVEYRMKARDYTDDLLGQTEGNLNEAAAFLSENWGEIEELLNRQTQYFAQSIKEIESRIAGKYASVIENVKAKTDIIAENRNELKGNR